MIEARALHLDRPAFWTETGDPKSWFRALQAIAEAAQKTPQTGTPRTVAERCLVGVIAWRERPASSAPIAAVGVTLLPGVGLVARDVEGRWDLTAEARALLRHWKDHAALGLEQLAVALVRESLWLRLLLLRLHQGDWELAHWTGVRSGRAGLKAGRSLLLHSHADPDAWFDGLAQQTSARWLARAQCDGLDYLPGVFTRKKGKDDLSLAPLTAPLHLLEIRRLAQSYGPADAWANFQQTSSARRRRHRRFTDIINGKADMLGFVAAREPPRSPSCSRRSARIRGTTRSRAGWTPSSTARRRGGRWSWSMRSPARRATGGACTPTPRASSCDGSSIQNSTASSTTHGPRWRPTGNGHDDRQGEAPVGRDGRLRLPVDASDRRTGAASSKHSVSSSISWMTGPRRFAHVVSVIAPWGIGKSRLGYELVAQINDASRGWWVRRDRRALEEGLTVLR